MNVKIPHRTLIYGLCIKKHVLDKIFIFIPKPSEPYSVVCFLPLITFLVSFLKLGRRIEHSAYIVICTLVISPFGNQQSACSRHFYFSLITALHITSLTGSSLIRETSGSHCREYADCLLGC